MKNVLFKFFMILVIFLCCSSIVFASEDANLENNSFDGEFQEDLVVDDQPIDSYDVYDFLYDERYDVDIYEDNMDYCEILTEFDYSFYSSNSDRIISSDLVKYYKNSSSFKAKFLNANNNPLVNTNVTFILEKNPTEIFYYTRTTNNEGIASLAINWGPGVYTVTSVNPVDDSCVVNSITVLSTLICSDLVKYYKNDSQFYVTALDGQGNKISNVIVSMNINGVFYNRTTNGSGVARLNINLNPGTYIVTVYHPLDGLSFSRTITVLSIFVPITNAVIKGEAYYIKVLNGRGQPSPYTTITFNLQGHLYDRNSTLDGIVGLNINWNPGQYTVTSIYNGCTYGEVFTVYHDMVYNLASRHVVPITTHIQQGGVYKFKLVEDNLLPIGNKEVIVTINNNGQTVKTNNQGLGMFKINLNPGIYSLTFTYEGRSVTKQLTIISGMGGDDVSLIPLTNAAENNGSYQVKLINTNTGAGIGGQSINFNINNQLNSVVTNFEGIASLSLSTITGLSSGVYSVLINYEGNPYKPASNYSVLYIRNASYDSTYGVNNLTSDAGNTFSFYKEDWINPKNFVHNIMHDNRISVDDVSSDYMVSLSNYLNRFDNKIESVIYMNSYIASFRYDYYLGPLKTPINTITSFVANCEDHTNVFVSLARIANLPARYLFLTSKNGGDNHVIGQVLIDNIWITVDCSAANAITKIKFNQVNGLGNKDYLLNLFNFSESIFIRYSSNEGYHYFPFLLNK